MTLDTLKPEELPEAFLAALWLIPGETKIEQLRMTKREMWAKLRKLAMLERAYPDLCMALEGVVEEHDQLGHPPTTRSIYARVILGRLRAGEYESAAPRQAAETMGERRLGPEMGGAEHHPHHSAHR